MVMGLVSEEVSATEQLQGLYENRVAIQLTYYRRLPNSNGASPKQIQSLVQVWKRLWKWR